MPSKVTMRIVIVDWKKPLIEAAFSRFRESQSLCFNENLISFCTIYNSCTTLQLHYSRNRQLVKIYLLLNNFKKISWEKSALMITPSACMALFVLLFSCCCSSALIWNLKAYCEDQQRWAAWKIHFQSKSQLRITFTNRLRTKEKKY